MSRIIILTELYFPEQTSTGYLLTKTAEGLAKEYKVKVITGPATNFFLAEKSPPQETINNVDVIRCVGTTFNKDYFWGRILNILTRTIAIFLKCLILCQQEDCLLVVTNPPLLPLVALLIKWLKNCRYVLLVHDVYPEVLIATQFLSPSSALVKILNVANKVIYKNAIKIISLGRDMNKLIESKLSSKETNKIYLITNWADEEIVATEKHDNPMIKELNFSHKFIVLYAGNIGITHGIEYLALAAEKLKLNSSIHFIVLGFGSKQSWLVEYISGKDLKNISILPPRLRSEQIIFLNACDIALISFIPGMGGVSVPSRMYNQMAAGKPIIAITDDSSELAQVVQEENIGWVVAPGNLDKLVETIEFAASHPDICKQMGDRAAVISKTKYNFDLTDQKYKQLFRDIFAQTT
ncbi:MAG: glycosyltransferase family 4 protein [Microcystis sp. LE17-20A]|jgi:colanic acid biosynthesis glycosyl transferase WcaI|uniref:Glycosyltransferase WbuB n=1 Tax=Microcystis aeruginosa Ma_OC_H_19870700_S124 TaxID=2486262 RepID=A0A552A7J3_MICAE|nr:MULTISPECIES: glycosyltransferase family 4 protein [unclassified Microcystis]MCZ8038962.1 glycosyltransferase family 4 protein [Microcystis sp. LE17-20A]MCZ8058057.1 glycosyltransferase family 4 protein [Microcystis sp. LE19-12.2C]MCZ8213054.1 glycosyltransferase family 4 protein [Microcystis sp. LE19-8.1F]TRT81424.1 MAG: glycosyltransferase WbuB [Microcystis aeruginosa Ma_OC_H_19870700_S124]